MRHGYYSSYTQYSLVNEILILLLIVMFFSVDVAGQSCEFLQNSAPSLTITVQSSGS
jgi:hypothetical protein